MAKKEKKRKSSSFQGTKINPTKFHPSQIKFLVILIPISIFMILPIIYIASSAFKPIDELFAFPPAFLVKKPTLNNFVYLFSTTSSGIPKFRFLFNSFVVTIVVVILTVIISAMAAYALSKKQFALKKMLFEVNTVALMFVATTVIIPRFMVINKIGIFDSFMAHVLPMVAMPIGLFLVKQFIDQIPDALIEAAKIDGANDIIIFKDIIVPVVAPALATVAILAFQATWNSPDTSKYYVDDETMKTFAFYMTTLTSAGNVVAGQGMAAAASLVMFVPNLLIFIFMQSKVMNTMAHSGFK